MNKRVFITFLSFLIILGGTLVAIKFAQGYRPTRNGTITGTGLLAANSFPNGASLYINGNLTSATDTTINLPPGGYDVEIRKDGYTTWRKKLMIEKELVTQTNALLLPTAPSLTPLSFTGADNVTPSSDGQLILFTTASASATKANGVYVMDLSESPMALQRGPRQITGPLIGWDPEKLAFLWSPDSNQILMSDGKRSVLLSSSRLTDLESASDVGLSALTLLDQWEEELNKKRHSTLIKFPEEVVQIATQSAQHMYISPDQERIVYTATNSATLASSYIPAVPAANTQPQERILVPGKIYVYDRHEDRNFAITESTYPIKPQTPVPSPKTAKPAKSPLPIVEAPLSREEQILTKIRHSQEMISGFFSSAPQWLPDSKHLIFANNGTIDLVEFDGTNQTKIYAGPFAENLVYPWPNGSKLIILTNFNQAGSNLLNLYALGLR